MSDQDKLLAAVVLIVGFMLFTKSRGAAGGSTGVQTIGPGGAPLMPCCDPYGNIVDAGSSLYCPDGSQVC